MVQDTRGATRGVGGGGGGGGKKKKKKKKKPLTTEKLEQEDEPDKNEKDTANDGTEQTHIAERNTAVSNSCLHTPTTTARADGLRRRETSLTLMKVDSMPRWLTGYPVYIQSGGQRVTVVSTTPTARVGALLRRPGLAKKKKKKKKKKNGVPGATGNKDDRCKEQLTI